MSIEKFWDEKFSKKNLFGTRPTRFAKEAKIVMKKEKVKTVLDLGCGQGRDSVYFAENGFFVTSVDISSVALKQLKPIARKLKIILIKMNVEDISPKIGKFGCIYSNMALQYTRRGILEKIILSIHEMLVKDGFLLFTIKNMRDARYGEGEKIEKNTFMQKGIVQYFPAKNFLFDMLKPYFKVKVISEGRRKGLDRREDAWWKVIAKKR